MNKKYVLITIALLIVIAAGAAYALTQSKDNNSTDVSTSSQAQKGDSGSSSVELNNQIVTKVGTIGCLAPTDSSGPQTTSCAIGIKLDDGTSYGLNADDPSVTGSLQTGKRVQVTGTLTEQSSPYDADGTIQVKSIQ